MNLASLVTEFTTKGEAALSTALDDIQAKTARVQKVVSGVSDVRFLQLAKATVQLRKEQEALAKKMEWFESVAKRGLLGAYLDLLAKKAAPLARALGGAFDQGAAAVTSFTKSALMGSHLGELLSFQLERLGRTVGGLVAPEFQKLIDLIGRIALKFESLSAKQREQAANILQGVFAFKAMRTVLASFAPVLGPIAALVLAITAGFLVGQDGLDGFLASFKPLIDALGSLAAVIGEALKPVFETIAEIIKAIAPLIAGVIHAIAKVLQLIGKILKPIFDAIKWIFEKIGGFFRWLFNIKDKAKMEEGKGRDPLQQKLGGFESVEATWQRIALASRKIGISAKPIDEQSLDELKQIKDNTKQTKDEVKNLKPGVKA